MNDQYINQRSKVEEYFDRTALLTWERLTSDAPVSRIRKTVRAGRDQMRSLFLSRLPQDMKGRRVLDAGCGTGSMAIEMARRGAQVVAIDLSPSLVAIAQERYQDEGEKIRLQSSGRIEWRAGDMLAKELGHFDDIVSMDCLIHYQLGDCLQAIDELSQRCESKLLFTFAPGTTALLAMHAVGQWFPRKDRSPNIHPIRPQQLTAGLLGKFGDRWEIPFTQRVQAGFYTSQLVELSRV